MRKCPTFGATGAQGRAMGDDSGGEHLLVLHETVGKVLSDKTTLEQRGEPSGGHYIHKVKISAHSGKEGSPSFR